MLPTREVVVDGAVYNVLADEELEGYSVGQAPTLTAPSTASFGGSYTVNLTLGLDGVWRQPDGRTFQTTPTETGFGEAMENYLRRGQSQLIPQQAVQSRLEQERETLVRTSGYSQIMQTPQGTRFADSPRTESVEEIRAKYLARQAALQLPTITPIKLPTPQHGTNVRIIHVGDIHIGTDACTYLAFKEILAYILHTPDTYLALQGDMVDLLTSQSVGVMAEQALTIQEQFTLATADLLPLAQAGKILWMLKGNHEDRLDKATKNIVEGAQWMARLLDVRYLGTENYTRVQCGGAEYVSYNTHGFNAGGSAGARRNKMEKMLAKTPSADIITCGHNHHLDAIQVVDDYVDTVSYRRIHKQRWGVYTGTYHSYMGYAAEFGLGQGPLGCVAVNFNIETGALLPQVLPVIVVDGKYKHVLPH